jgi:hypothetical protein
MPSNIYGSGLDGLFTMKQLNVGRDYKIAQLLKDGVNFPPEKQAEVLEQLKQVQDDKRWAEQMAKVMVDLVKNINP